jgi:hypothetical protein
MDRSLGEELPCGLPVEGVEGPPPAPLLAHQPGVLELLYVVGDLRLAHRRGFLELADADALVPLIRCAPEPEKSQQPLPSAIMPSILTRMGSERAPTQRDEPLHPLLDIALLSGVATQAVSSTTPSFSALTMPPSRTVCGP